MVTFRPDLHLDKDAVLIMLTADQVKARKFPFKSRDLSGCAGEVVSSGQFEGNAAELFPLIIDRKLFLLAGLGNEKDLTLTGLRVHFRRSLLSVFLKKARSVEVLAHTDRDDAMMALAETAVIGTYSWRKYITPRKDDRTVFTKDVYFVARPRPSYLEKVKVAANVNFVRDLVNDNADTVTSLYLEKCVKGIVKGRRHVKLQVFDRKKLTALHMGLLLAVNQGSEQEPRMFVVKYQGGRKTDPYLAIVGKGLTYDTGGLNLKPTGSMETMRMDMSGAAAVIGVLKTVLDLKLKKNIIFACGIAENAIDARSYKPGDVIRGYAGKTVEVGNTDAEGRLVLADVLAYLVKNEKPARIIDLATLTGAVVVALGHDYTGLVSNNDDLAGALLNSAAATDDRLWRLPSYPELKDAMKSKIADIKNTSNYKGAAGTLTGAEFLRQFIGDTPWAHLDIAGTAFVEGDSRSYFAHGATGAGVRLLVDYLKKS